MDAPPERETPLPHVLGGQEGNGAEVSQDTTGAHDDDTRRASRRESFRVQGAIREILRADALKHYPNKFPGNVWRVVNCHWCRAGMVEVVRSLEFGTAHYKGLQTCGSVWLCPRCACKVQERRRSEMAVIFMAHQADGKDAVMVSYTFPHRIDEPLHDLRRKQAKALRILRNSRDYKKLLVEIGYVGLVRTLEVTRGPNGWHPHTHEALLIDPALVPVNHREHLATWLQVRLSEMWLKACKKVGLFKPERDREEDFLMRAVHVLDNASFEYLAKQDDIRNWGLSHEMAKQASKQGRRSGVHPFRLAVRGQPGDDVLFIEYARAMKGARQIYFSPGLRERFGLEEKTDEQIIEEETDNTEKIAGLPPQVWRFVLKKRVRAEVLDAAEAGGKDGIARLLFDLGFIPESRSDDK